MGLLNRLLPPRGLTSNRLIVLVAVFLMAFANHSFLLQLVKIYPLNAEDAGFLISVVIGFTGFLVVLFGLLCWRYTIRPLLIFTLMASANAAYFMDSYHVMIDESMLVNAMATDTREVGDLLSLKMAVYVLLLGVLPSLWVARVKLHDFRLLSRVKLLGITLVLMAGMALGFSDYYSTFFREHKPIRYYFNPGGYLYGSFKLVKHQYKSSHRTLTQIGLDAKTEEEETHTHRELLIVVVGETARADRFSLNGYGKETNPLLKKQDIINFPNVRSCGTSTAVSVPCMFSNLTTDGFEKDTALYTENALDVMARAGVQVLWRDNNSSSKGVADRMEYQDFRDAKLNPVCDEVECRDIGMLSGLQDYIDAHPDKDIAIVLHQMGNHGPAYYKRYPKEFEKFTPVCKTNELKDCSLEEIGNAYDNAILYTDYFLNEVIELLKKNGEKYETAMFYISDHGESLGENGLYLHGMPNFIAPDTQRHVPMIFWFGDNFGEINVKDIRSHKDQPFTHDNLFHTLLGFMEVESKAYDVQMDILKKKPRP